MSTKLFAMLSACLCCFSGGVVAADDPPAWVEPMKSVRARFTGEPGTLALFGDSISVSQAFWSPLAGEPQEMSPQVAERHRKVKAFLKPECWSEWRGADYGNEGGMTIRWARDNIDRWLEKLNPEAAVVLFGTNDLHQLELEEFERKTQEVVERCLANGTVVLLTTLPPRSGYVEKSNQFAQAVRRVAEETHVPLIDYQAAILERRPDDWDGSLPQFAEAAGKGEYEVRTLISGDGVHPSYPAAHQGFSSESLRSNGYSLRSYVTLLAYAELVERVFPAIR